MAMIKCRECGGDISDKAFMCPHCGFPVAGEISTSVDGQQSYTASGYVETKRKSPLKRLTKVAAITIGSCVAATIVFVLLFQIPSVNAFALKTLSSTNVLEALQSIQQFFGKNNLPAPSSAPSIAQRPTPVTAPPSTSTPQTRLQPTASPVASNKKPPANTPYFVPNPNETCSQQAADWVNKENNGNPNGNSMSSGVNGKTVFQGIVKTTLYKTFSTPSAPCLFAQYTTWTQSSGELWQQQLGISNITNPDALLWENDMQPSVSQDSMLQALDAGISAVEQSNGGAATQSGSQQTVPTVNIAEQSLVALLCYYSDGSVSRGSGVVVNPQGYILTAKHIVDPSWTSWAYGTAPRNATLNYCEVGIPPPNTLPTVQEIQSVNPSIAVSPSMFPLDATLYFEPSQGSLSNNEYRVLDFAVLKISKPSENCASYNLCTLPTVYPYNPVYYAAKPDTVSYNQVINFGYPGEAITTSTSQNFETFNLKGAVGRLVQYYGGDQYFKNQLLDFSWSAIDVIPGRSGSPVFWHGYVVGIEDSGAAQNVTNDYAIGLPAIEQILKNSGLGNILATQ